MSWQPIPMNTGFNPTQACYNEDLLKRVRSIMAMFLEKAIILGAQYMKAANRTTLTSVDMLYALQYQAQHFVNDIQTEPNLEEKLDAKLDSDSDSDCESDSDFESESDSESESENFTRADDTDALIAEMNRIHDHWSEWIPTDRIQQMVKESIDATYNIE